MQSKINKLADIVELFFGKTVEEISVMDDGSDEFSNLVDDFVTFDDRLARANATDILRAVALRLGIGALTTEEELYTILERSQDAAIEHMYYDDPDFDPTA